MLLRLSSGRTDVDYVQPLDSTTPYARAGSDALGLHAARRALLSGTSLHCLSGVASCHDLLHCASATYKTLSSTQPEGCLMTTDDNQKLRQLLDMTAALISSMDVARRGHTETDRTAWFSYKVFATRYMAIIHQLPQDFPALVVLNPYNTSDMPEPSGSVPSYQRPIFEGVYTDLSILRSSLESIIGTAGDERRALTDFFQSRLRAAMMERPENEKAVQDTVEALLVGRGLQKGQEYDRETGRVKLSSKESIPDFILPPFEEAIEVKLVKDRRRVSEVIDEINADIPAYLSKYRHLLFIVYDLGQIQDEAEFRYGLEHVPNVQVIVVKH